MGRHAHISPSALTPHTPTHTLAISKQGHPFYVAAQFHPEFKSRPGKPSPLFLGLVLAAAGKLDNWLSGNPLSPTVPAKRARVAASKGSKPLKENL
jgi:hypothetical protein